MVNMPGVDQKSVEVGVENNVLLLEGKVQFEGPADYQLYEREFEIGRYQRKLMLSEDVDVDGIKARVQYGVLEVTIPKREKSKAKKIEITS